MKTIAVPLIALILVACAEEAPPPRVVEVVVDEVVAEPYQPRSEYVGRLQALDEVAYVRFASVYRQFKDINQFMKEVKGLLDRQGEQ